MKLSLVAIRKRRLAASSPEAVLIQKYLDRAKPYLICNMLELESEEAFLARVETSATRTKPFVILLDSRGKLLTSEEFAEKLGQVIDSGTQQCFLAVGGADGWSPEALKRADLLLSFGRMTLPHELAAIIAAEQLYRALTIRAGHPYHSGHS